MTSISAPSNLLSAFIFSSQLPISGLEIEYTLLKMALSVVVVVVVVDVALSQPSTVAALVVPILILFCASRDCKSCSSSFTKSIAPPIIDAWSPFKPPTKENRK